MSDAKALFRATKRAADNEAAQIFKASVLPRLPELLAYRPDGSLVWRSRSREWFSTDHTERTWNGRYPGTLAMHKIGNHGYRCGTICNVWFLAHRVVWALHNGFWPDECDHINGVRHDNRIENLRDGDKSQNQKNAALRSDNTSGHVGVHQREDSGRWAAYIGSNGGLVRLGTFDTREAAIAARLAAELSLGFTQRHRKQLDRLDARQPDLNLELET